jgi:hypothetical protein
MIGKLDTNRMESWPTQSIPQVLEYTGEFGPELVLFVSFCNWLSKAGLLRSRRIQTYYGMRCFYDDLDCLEIVEKRIPRVYVKPHSRPLWLPVKDEHTFDDLGRSPLHLYPDLRGKYIRRPLIPIIETARRPLLVVHNKHNNEWRAGPVNHISLETLDRIFGLLKHDFTIVYVRHGMSPIDPKFSGDQNTPLPFPDRPLIDAHPEVFCFDDLYAKHRTRGGTDDINLFKNTLYSRCYHFISSQGGGAHHIAMFSGSLMVVLHRRGREETWAYGDGYYGFMAPVPPIRVICRTEDDLTAAMSLFLKTEISQDRVLLESGSAGLLARFSPWTISSRH